MSTGRQKDNTGPREFHISRQARDRYAFDESLYSLNGNVILADFRTTRAFAQKMNSQRNLVDFPEQAVQAGQINAMGLIDEILHYVVGQYRKDRNSQVFSKALAQLEKKQGADKVEDLLRHFVTEFPPVAVYHGKLNAESYLGEESDGTPNKEIALEELLSLWLANVNPAFSPFAELFDDDELAKDTVYSQAMVSLKEFFAAEPPFGPDQQSLVDMLRSPALASPYSLSGQLEYIRERWGYMLGEHLYRLLTGLDLIKEEERPFFGGGPGPAQVYEFGGLESEPERFSADKDWMPQLVLLAKTTYVWLGQLSKEYGRPINRLDEVPDEALATLARQGFSGLWLIGLWERSPASKRIKEMMGNPEALASAYSLFSYEIAADLGGEEAYDRLRERAWRHGLRLASDMVPNHMGIDSRWLIEHPDWFISLDYSPFPAYSFNGANLSWDERVGIYLEDHYYNHSDAAVVFKRVDHWTGSEKYIYHGNDGTSLPWNDTAQLNYLIPDVREAVIQNILAIARRFPIIRFDAAMTLAKRHLQRLWFPEPGSGGGIPSRAGFGLTKAQFDAAMPEEFWREVVDRVAAEVPDTLLLAEAFWLMEGYFVRSLGMHRVYNSAFMNMLRDEENANYRSVLKNTLEFDPEVLKRYVNFMNNPDERTAVDQFGKDDKYFGVCTMMATLPGLPMFGHGQIEGYAEKYGMEFRRAYWDEEPDRYLVERHERQIFPLLHRRHLFAGVDNFLLYDLFTAEGFVNEDVFAYSNRVGEERALVVYNNKFGEARGWLQTSVAYLAKEGEERRLVQWKLSEGLGLHHEGDYFAIYRDLVSGLEYIRISREIVEKGLYVQLGAYKHHVFLDWREVKDSAWRQYSRLAMELNGRGVPSIEEALQAMILHPVRQPFAELLKGDLVGISKQRGEPNGHGLSEVPEAKVLDQVEAKLRESLIAAKQLTGGGGDPHAIARDVRLELETVCQLVIPNADEGVQWQPQFAGVVNFLRRKLDGDPTLWDVTMGWLFTHRLGKVVSDRDYAELSRAWLDEWLLGKIIAEALQERGLGEGEAWRGVTAVAILTEHQDWYRMEVKGASRAFKVLEGLLADRDVQRYLGVNRYEGVLWFNKEAMERLLWWLTLVATVESSKVLLQPSEEEAQAVIAAFEVVEHLRRAVEASNYKVDKLLAAART